MEVAVNNVSKAVLNVQRESNLRTWWNVLDLLTA